jgi:Fe-S oxidoreductase
MDTGCCGMAGTFGYDAEHYDVSMKVGELRLFPKVRGLSVNDRGSVTGPWSIENRKHLHRMPGQVSEVVSSGAACRMQIQQGTGVHAVHPIVLVADFVRALAHAEVNLS